jgi:hypothetical protein
MSPPPPKDREEELKEQTPARTLRAQRQVADELIEHEEEEQAQPLRRKAVEEPEERQDEQPDELRPIRRRVAADGTARPVPGASPPFVGSWAAPSGPVGLEAPVSSARAQGGDDESAGPDHPAGPVVPPGAERATLERPAERGRPPVRATAPINATEPIPQQVGDGPIGRPSLEFAAAASVRPLPVAWPSAAEPLPPPVSQARPDVLIEHIDVIVNEPAAPSPPASSASHFRRAIAARYLRGL